MSSDFDIRTNDSSADRAFLRLLQFADSALPIGTPAHSFGFEGLAECGALSVSSFSATLRDYLQEGAIQEAACCIAAAQCSSQADWRCLNQTFRALRLARETRTASVAMGKRMLLLAESFHIVEEGVWANAGNAHHCAVFGLVAGRLGVEPRHAAEAYIHQNVSALLSASQRLLPVGQVAAATLLWNLKDEMIACVDEAIRAGAGQAASFSPLLDIAAMAHPWMGTRLFVS